MADVLTIVDGGKQYFCDVQTAKQTPENIVLGMFVNDAVISDASVLADLTQMSTHGITEKVLSGASWPTSAINANGQAESTYPVQDFTASSVDHGTLTNVYGYYARNAVTGILLWVVKFDAVKPIQYENEKISVIPTLRYDQKA